MRKIFSALLLLAAPALYAQQPCDVRLNNDTLDFGKISSGSVKEETVQIQNFSSGTIEVRGIDFGVNSDRENGLLNNFFSLASAKNFSIAPNAIAEIKIRFSAKQNLSYQAPAFIHIKCQLSQFSIPLFLKGEAEYQDEFQTLTKNLHGLLLKNSLQNYTVSHTTYSYKDARTKMFEQIDNQNGEVECVYTGRKISHTSGIPDINTTKFNTEHTWPQSCGSDNEPARSDIFHLYPTDETANSRRGNAPFGKVDTPCWEVGGSKSENCTGDKNDWFEPRNVHKGNVARSIFYYATTYGNRNCDVSGNVYPFLNQQQENFLRQWHTLDTVDAREQKRNADIAAFQGRKNPFISHPELTDRIFSFSGNANFPELSIPRISDEEIILDTRNSDTIAYEIFVYNLGQKKLAMEERNSNVAVANSEVALLSSDSLAQGEFTKVQIFLIGLHSKNFVQYDTLKFTDPAIAPVTYRVRGITEPNSVAELLEEKNSLEQNFPNPVEDFTTIKIHLNSLEERFSSSLKFYTSEGKEIFDATHSISWDNNYDGELRLSRSELQQYGKIFFYRLSSNIGQTTKNLILE